MHIFELWALLEFLVWFNYKKPIYKGPSVKIRNILYAGIYIYRCIYMNIFFKLSRQVRLVVHPMLYKKVSLSEIGIMV